MRHVSYKNISSTLGKNIQQSKHRCSPYNNCCKLRYLSNFLRHKIKHYGSVLCLSLLCYLGVISSRSWSFSFPIPSVLLKSFSLVITTVHSGLPSLCIMRSRVLGREVSCLSIASRENNSVCAVSGISVQSWAMRRLTINYL